MKQPREQFYIVIYCTQEEILKNDLLSFAFDKFLKTFCKLPRLPFLED